MHRRFAPEQEGGHLQELHVQELRWLYVTAFVARLLQERRPPGHSDHQQIPREGNLDLVFMSVYFKLNSVLKTNCTILKYKDRIKRKQENRKM